MKEENTKVEVKVEEGVKTLEILRGNAKAPFSKPHEIGIVGGIDAPAEFLSKKEGVYKEVDAHVLVDRQERTVRIVLNEKDSNGGRDIVTGSLVESGEVKAVGINDYDRLFNVKGFSKMIRENEWRFANKVLAKDILASLARFSFSLDKNVSQKDDELGNTHMGVETKLRNLEMPLSFDLEIRLWRGKKQKTIVPVEIRIDVASGGVQFYLVSTALYGILEEEAETYMNTAIDDIRQQIDCSIIYT